MEPLLSIVVPVYNAESFLHECIDSVIHQSYSNFELLLVDDGSTDNSLAICKKYEDEDGRVKTISLNHVGPYEARKSGVLQSRGDYITFLDADDFVDKISYSLALGDMENAIDVIMFDIYRYHNKDDIRYDARAMANKIYNRSQLEKEIYPIMIWEDNNHSSGIDPSLCNKVFKADLLKKYYAVSREIRFHYGEDVAVIYPVLKMASSISIHHQAYYYHRQRRKNVIAPYIMDEMYLDKLHDLYSCLITDLGNDQNFRRQIDLFYAYSVELIKQKYGIPQNLSDVIFPFDKVNAGEKIVLYGAGNVGRLYMKQLRMCSFYEVVCWVDKNYEVLKDEILSPEEILKTDYDKIVVAIAEPSIVENVIEYLVDMKVDRNKIVF